MLNKSKENKRRSIYNLKLKLPEQEQEGILVFWSAGVDNMIFCVPLWARFQISFYAQWSLLIFSTINPHLTEAHILSSIFSTAVTPASHSPSAILPSPLSRHKTIQMHFKFYFLSLVDGMQFNVDMNIPLLMASRYGRGAYSTISK